MLRPDGSTEPVGRVIDLTQHVFLIMKTTDTNHRAKDFLLPASIVGFGLQNHRGVQVIALGVRTIASACQRPSLGAGTFNVADSTLERCAADTMGPN